MDEREMRDLLEDVVAVTRVYVAEQIAPLLTRLDGLTNDVAAVRTEAGENASGFAREVSGLVERANAVIDGLTPRADAAEATVAEEVAALQREARHERELRDAQFAARMAELEARISAVAELERKVAERLATLKDGEPGRDGTDGKDGADGKDAVAPSAEEIAALLTEEAKTIAAETARAVVDAWDRPKDGKDADPEVMRQMIEEAVAAIPAPKDGRDGVDGKDGEPGPKGEPGVSVSDVDVEVIDDGATAAFRFTVGEVAHCFEVPLPVGPAGRDGADGERGEKGEAGPVGSLPLVRAWEDRVHYEGEVVTFDGETFQAIRDSGKAPPHEDWVCIVARGRDGKDADQIEVRSTFDPSEAYRRLNIVALNGAAFIARKDDPGPCPGEGWQVIAMQGKQGKPGMKGDTGMGLRGLPGASITRMEIDDEGLLTATRDDGQKVECDLYPVLSRISR